MFRRTSNEITDKLLSVPGLYELCSEYLRYVKGMESCDNAIRHAFDSQRQVAHNQLLQAIGKTRADNINMVAYCRAYLGRNRYESGIYEDYDE